MNHKTSSPGYPQSNGKAESAVKTAKRLMQKAKATGKDPYLAILDHRSTPSQGLQASPSQMLASRRTRTLLTRLYISKSATDTERMEKQPRTTSQIL